MAFGRLVIMQPQEGNGKFDPKTAAAHAYVQSSFRWAILFFIPAPASWINGYALSTKPALRINGCTSSSEATTLASFRREWGTSVIANYMPFLQPRGDISPGVFVTACVALVVLVCVHRRLHDRDNSCDWIMAASIGTAFAVGTWARMDTLAIVLNLMPWAAWAGCIIAEAVCTFI